MPEIYAEVILPKPLNTTFTYRVPDELHSQVKVGYRVIVPFGRKNTFYTAIVINITHIAPSDYEVKDLILTLDHYPIIRHPQLKLWQWISEYYLCAIGDVYKAAVPAGLKIESETIIELNPDFEENDNCKLNPRE